jgi:hypothetical protein
LRRKGLLPRLNPTTLSTETVAERPGLSSSCTMQCCKGLSPAFGLGLTPHIQGQTRPDLLLRPPPVDTLWHLAIAPVTPLHRMRGGGQPLVSEQREGFIQGGGKEFLQCRPPLGGTAGADAAVCPVEPERSGFDSAEPITPTSGPGLPVARVTGAIHD